MSEPFVCLISIILAILLILGYFLRRLGQLEEKIKKLEQKLEYHLYGR